MNCASGKHKTCRDKSCQRFYNNNVQELTAGEEIQLVIAGTRVVDTGISIETEPQNYTTLKTGLYHFAGDVVIEGTAGGVAVLQMYMDGVPLPCTKRTRTIPATGYVEIHTETDLELTGCCCDVSHTFTFRITTDSTATGNVIEFCSGVVKLA